MAYSTLTYVCDARIARITLDRLQRMNAITTEMPGDLEAAVRDANADERVHVIVLSGNGAAFCSGYDLKDFAESETGSSRPGRVSV